MKSEEFKREVEIRMKGGPGNLSMQITSFDPRRFTIGLKDKEGKWWGYFNELAHENIQDSILDLVKEKPPIELVHHICASDVLIPKE